MPYFLFRININNKIINLFIRELYPITKKTLGNYILCNVSLNQRNKPKLLT